MLNASASAQYSIPSKQLTTHGQTHPSKAKAHYPPLACLPGVPGDLGASWRVLRPVLAAGRPTAVRCTAHASRPARTKKALFFLFQSAHCLTLLGARWWCTPVAAVAAIGTIVRWSEAPGVPQVLKRELKHVPFRDVEEDVGLLVKGHEPRAVPEREPEVVGPGVHLLHGGEP